MKNTLQMHRLKVNIAFLFFLFAFPAFIQKAHSQTPIYSIGGGGIWTTVGTWSLVSHSGASCGCLPTATNDVKIGAGHTVTIPSAGVADANSIEVNDDNTSGNLILGTSVNTGFTLTVGNFTVNTGGVVSVGGNNGATHSISITGNVTVNGSFNMLGVSGDRVNVTMDGLTTKTFSGSGSTFSFYGLTIGTLGPDVNVNSSISITNNLNWTGDGLLIVNSSSDITVSAAATITNYSSARYVQLDGSNSTNSRLIKLNNNTTGAWRIVFPIGTSVGGYTPLDLSAAGGSLMTTNPTNNSTLGVKVIYNGSSQGQMRRQFRLTVAGNSNATTFSGGDFYYNSSTDISAGDVQANYNTLWYLNTATGGWATVTGTAPGTTFFTAPGVAQSLATGTYYYAIGNSTAFTNTWYSYQTGIWSDPEVWTLDPSGTSFINPSNLSPLSGDAIVVLNGFTITSDVNNVILSSTTIQGGAVLDMSTTTGHNLGTVAGTGLLRVKGTALPSGTYTSFVSTTGGTIEYYDASGTLTSQATYNKLIFSNSTASNIVFTATNNFTVNGTFNITRTGTGTTTWQINDNSNASRTFVVNGNLTVDNGGLITAGTGNSASTTQHSLTLNSDFTNNGVVQFFDPTDATYSLANYTSGATWTSASRGNAVGVTFGGLTNTTLTCNNTTDFYRFIVNKGTGQQAVLTVNSSATTNFRLFGPNNQGSSGTAPNAYSDNSFSLINGTVQLTGNIDVPNIVESGGSWPLPQNGCLWLNGNVTFRVTSNSTVLGGNSRMMIVYGRLRLSNAGVTFNSGYSRGLLGGQSGELIMENGTINTWQFRTTNLGSGNNFAYSQSGGTINVGTAGLAGEDVTDYPRFALPYTTTSFTMSGGTLNVASPMNGGTSNTGGIMINAAASSIQVTGGTVNVFVPASAVNFTITSNASFYDMNINKQGAGAAVAQLAAINANDGVAIAMTAKPLTILNDLTLVAANSPTLVCNNNNVTIGGDFDIQTGTTFTPGTNTLTFNGSAGQNWTHNGTITSLNAIVVSKTGTLQLGGASTFPNITSLTLTSGTLDDGGKTLTVTTTLSNSAIHQGTGLIIANGPTTISGNNGTFGNLNIQTNATVATAGNQTVTGTLRLVSASSTLNIGINNLTVQGSIFADAATGTTFSNTKRILTNGARNDGGLTRAATLGQLLTFPVGTTTVLFTPISIRVDAATSVGQITVRPVKSAHPNVTATNASLQYFWRVTSTGFAGVTSVTHNTYTFSTATKNGTLTDYHVARYDPVAFTWAYRTTAFDATAATAITPADFNTGTGWTGLASDQLDGEYTAGNPSAFGSVVVYYSRVTSGNWGTAATWSNIAINGTASATTPCATCPVVIGDVSNNHTVSINANNQSCGSLSVSAGSVLDCGAFTGLSFGESAPVAGNGKIRIGSANFPAGDFINFIGTNGGTIEWYGPAYTIPSSGPAPASISLVNYYNLQISPNAGVSITMPANDLTIYNNFTVSGASATGQVNTNTGATRNITVTNNLDVNSGILSVRNGAISAFTVNGNTTVAASATFSVQNAGGTRTHTFTTPGDFTNNGTVLFRSAAGSEFVNLTFTGTTDKSITGSNGAASTTLNTVVVNKGTSQIPTLTIDVAGTVSTLSNSWLTLTNGTINFNKSGGTFILTNTASNPFSIPATSKLKVSAGTVTVSNVASDNSDVILAGAIEVAGGTLNVGTSANNNNNDIEYASAGSPTITVSSGATLYVNGAIRRPTTTLAGALVYTQTGGTVTLGGRNANNTRGVFEIENSTGSSFTLSGTGSLSVLRPTGGTLFTDLYLNPASSSVAATSTIYLGIAGTTQTIDINVVPSLGNMLVYDNTTASMQSSTLTTAGTLTINTAAATLLTNSLDVTIGGDLAINGTGVYNGTIGSGNTTIFNGTGSQSAVLSSGSTFLNMTVNKPSGTVALSGTSPTITNLNILSGVLDVNSLNLSVIGDIVNNSSQINTGGTGSISLAGGAGVTTQNITSSGGSFANLTLTGSATTKTVYLTGNLTINGTLNFATTNRYLAVGSYRVTFGTSGASTGAGSSSFIRTNGVSSDLGVVKNWAAGTSSFAYPVGTRTNYTPITLTLTVTTPGDLTVVPVDDRHPTANTGSTEQILDYYWVITRGSTLVYNATGSHVYAFPSALMGGTGGSLVAGYLDIGSSTPGWITSGHGGSATTSSMTFTNLLSTNLPTAGKTFHYSVGTTSTLPNPITPIYSRLADANVANMSVGGDWNNTNSWTLSPDGLGAPWGSIPYGNSIVILPNSRINISTTGRIAFITQVDGMIVLPSNKVGHDFGVINGTGTIQTNTGTLPAGNYTTFVSTGGGTIEYVAPLTMNNRSTYNHLSVIGSGSVTMTNTDLTLNGNMTIASGATLNNSVNNRNITVNGSWSNSGTFTPGTATVTFTGGSAQTIAGNTSFYNLVVSKSGNNVTLTTGTTTTVTNNLTLTTRHIVASSTHLLSLGSATITGGSASSFIAGRVSKIIPASGSYTMPLGSIVNGLYRPASLANTSALDTWVFEYVGNNPTDDGYDIARFDNPNIKKVSMFEYWNISRAGATIADLSLTYGTGSYIPPNIGNVANLKVVKWNSATTQWELATGATGFSQSGTNTAGTVTGTQITSFSPHTLGSPDFDSPLPIELVYFNARLVNNQVELKWETAQEIDNDFFTVERASDPELFEPIIHVKGHGTTNARSRYSATDARPLPGTTYYRLKQTDFNGRFSYSKPQAIQYDGPDFVSLHVYPNPSEGKTMMIEVTGLKDETEIPVEIVNAHGQKVYANIFEVKTKGMLQEKIVFGSPLNSGIYIIKAGPYLQMIKKVVVE